MGLAESTQAYWGNSHNPTAYVWLRNFALLAAVDIENQPDGSISLEISKLKPGVEWNDHRRFETPIRAQLSAKALRFEKKSRFFQGE